MPLLAALDECNCALTRIELCARLGLRYPEIREAAMALILANYYEVNKTIGGIALGEHQTEWRCP